MFASHSYVGRPALTLLLASALHAVPAAGAREWHFDVAVDGIPMGTYRVAVQESGDTGVVTSDISVGVLGIGAYRQRAEETWKGGCLVSIASTTEDRGRVTTFAGRQEGDVFRAGGATSDQRPGCVMSFAYWNPDVLKQSHLINVQTGAWTPVRVRDLGEDRIEVGGAPVQAVRYAIETASNTIELWYSLAGEWLSLKTTTKTGGHVLAYRLRSRKS